MQGATVWSIDDELPPHRSGIYMIDLSSNDTATKLVNITFEGSYRETNSPDFTPHGMSHWVTKNGEMILYIINHRRRGDTVDSFVYNPQKKSLKYRKSFENPLLYNQNDLVVVDLDKFYVTIDHYYTGAVGRTAEDMLKLPLGRILYIDGSGPGLEVKVAMNGVRLPNGIAMSNDNR
jgi:arylesterase/paraoxonase